MVKTNSDTVNLQTIVNEKLKDLYDQETLIEILRTYRAIYANDNVKNNACDVAFGIKYGKFLEKTDIKTISQKASNPDDSNNIQNGYFVNIGVSTYQAICQEKYGLSFTKHQITNSFSGIIDHPLQQIFYGAPGTGKSHKVNETTEQQPKENVFRTTFHPDSDYSTFVGCYKPTMKPTGVILASKENEEVITYKFVAQAFTKAYVRAWQTTEPVFLVIEEINRGNCAQIFGDLFQLLDRNDGVSEYPVDADTDLANFIRTELADSSRTDIPAEVKDGQKLLLPANLYIWATMNTSDQSLFPIDSAFKRRWEWKYIPIDTRKENWTIKVDGDDYDWSDFLEKINKKIDSTTHSEDKMLGFYFCKAENSTINAERFVNKVAFYLWNDVFKDYGFDDAIFNDENGEKLSFRKFYKNDGTVEEAKVKTFLDKLGVIHQGETSVDIEEELQ